MTPRRPRARSRRRSPAIVPLRPGVEGLEARALLTTFTVSNTGDEGTGSFRQAILDANQNAGPDRIDFQIAGEGVQTIAPLSELPTITDPVTIDATTQAGYSGTPVVRLSGASIPGFADGLTIAAGNSTVRGLVISGWPLNAGILIRGAGGNTIAGNFLGVDPTGTERGLGVSDRLVIDGSP